MKKYAILSIAIFALAIGAGCVLSSGTFILTYEVEGFGPIVGNMQRAHVDLTTEKDFDKHKDKIESIDAVSIMGDIVTDFGHIDSVEIWISDQSYDDPNSVRANGNSIFVSPGFDASHSLHIEYADGLRYVRNLDILKSKIENGGSFYLYGIPNGSGFLTYRLGIIVTMTAGL